MRRTTLIAAGLLAAAPLAAQETPADSADARVHVVRRGDTLWDLARRYLADPFLWPEIFRLNTQVVEDPALIFPDERLTIPGAPMRADAVAAAPTAPAARPARQGEPERTVFFRRVGGPETRERLIIQRAGTADVPVVPPGDVLSAAFVARPGEVRPLGVLAEVLDPSVVPTETLPRAALYDKVFVSLGAGAPVAPGDRLHFVRPGEEIRPYGRVHRATGLGTVAMVEDGVATVVVTEIYDRVVPGDLALAAPVSPVRPGVAPVADEGSVEASLIGFPSGDPLVALQDVGFVAAGADAGVQVGDEFSAYLPAEERAWGTRPPVEVARMRVVRVTAGTATVRVTDLAHPALEPGLPVRRVARMP